MPNAMKSRPAPSSRSWMLRLCASALCCAPLLAARPALAACDGPGRERERARELGQRGLEAFDAGDWSVAGNQFRRALACFEFPTLRLFLARSLRQRGRLVDAVKQYEALLASPVTHYEGEVGRRARETAVEERKLTAARRAVVAFDGTAPAGTNVEAGGRVFKDEDLAREQVLDPGEVTLRIRKPGRPTVERSLVLAEGDRYVMPLSDSAAQSPDPASDWTSSEIVLAVATVAMTAGVIVTGVVASASKRDFDDANGSASTAAALRDDASRMQWINAGFVLGALASGSTLIYLRVSTPSRATANVASTPRSHAAGAWPRHPAASWGIRVGGHF